ncbi:MAG: hypothetical protein ACT4O1_01635 [Gemmatimonadota bacterium]
MIARGGRLLVILTCVAAACNGAQDQPGQQQVQPETAATEHTQVPAVITPAEQKPPRPLQYLPQQKRDSIRIEGTTEPITLRLIQPPSASPPFYTYMPTDMAFEAASSGEGDGYYFYTNFGGNRNEDAYLLLFVFPTGATEADAGQRVRMYVESRGAPASADRKSFTFKRGGRLYAAGIELRRHGSRYYYLARQYPIEYADGFGPRAQKIIDEWQWLI